MIFHPTVISVNTDNLGTDPFGVSDPIIVTFSETIDLNSIIRREFLPFL